MLSRAARFGILLTCDDEAVHQSHGIPMGCGPAALGLANEQQMFLRRALEASSTLAQESRCECDILAGALRRRASHGRPV